MLLIRDIMYCKPGKVKPMVEKFLAMKKLGGRWAWPMRVHDRPERRRYWTIVAEIEVESLEAFMAMGRQPAPKETEGMDEDMSDYHELVESGTPRESIRSKREWHILKRSDVTLVDLEFSYASDEMVRAALPTDCRQRSVARDPRTSRGYAGPACGRWSLVSNPPERRRQGGALPRRSATSWTWSRCGCAGCRKFWRAVPNSSVADLSNRATHDADHDRWPLSQLVDRLEPARRALVAALRGAGDTDLDRSARHPRLGTPMRLIDLAYFVAEHDDHHLARLRQLLENAR